MPTFASSTGRNIDLFSDSSNYEKVEQSAPTTLTSDSKARETFKVEVKSGPFARNRLSRGTPPPSHPSEHAKGQPNAQGHSLRDSTIHKGGLSTKSDGVAPESLGLSHPVDSGKTSDFHEASVPLPLHAPSGPSRDSLPSQPSLEFASKNSNRDEKQAVSFSASAPNRPASAPVESLSSGSVTQGVSPSGGARAPERKQTAKSRWTKVKGVVLTLFGRNKQTSLANQEAIGTTAAQPRSSSEGRSRLPRFTLGTSSRKGSKDSTSHNNTMRQDGSPHL